MNARERREKIIEFVNELEKVDIGFLKSKFNVSEMTIYRDLQRLESQGYLKKIIGGAIKINDFLVHSESSFAKRLKIYNEEKKAIAKKAVEGIKDGDSIIVDAGTTSFLLVKEINKASLKDLTVITNNIIAQVELAQNKNVNVIATGGTVRDNSFSTVGVIAENILGDIMVDKVFITSKGISKEGNLLDPDLNEGRIKSLFIQRARKRVLIVDSSKFGIIGFYIFSNISKFDTVITDSNISGEYLKILNKMNVKLEIVKVGK